jgi:polyisoprenoid-binding protein YceI
MLLKLKNEQARSIEQPFIGKKRSFTIKRANNMKRTVLAFYSFVFSFILLAQTYTPIDDGSKVHFVIDNFGIATGGDFTGLTGTIKFDPANLANADFDVSVDANTVNTDITARDNHLRRSEYLDVKNYPKLSFKSTRVTKANKDGYVYMFGNITIKGVTKEVNFPFAATPKDGGYLFEGSFKLNRRDFGVGGNSISLSDEVTITLSISAKAN